MKKIFNIIIPIIFITISFTNLYAIPASRQPALIVQPDGTLLKTILKGDEFYRYRTTIDGYIIVKDSKGIYNYATHNQNGKFSSTGIKAHNIEARENQEIEHLKTLESFPNMQKIISSQRAKRISASKTSTSSYPLTGSPKSLVILVNFSDKSFVTSNPKDAFTKLLNEKDYSTNGGTGSARDYFRDASNGVFDPEFDVVGPFTLPQNTAYYGENIDDEDNHPRQMVIDACSLADQNGVDFTQYDTDNDGIVDNIFIYFAGHNEAENGGDDTVWPHRWTLASKSNKFDGKAIYDYACTSELKGRSGSNMCGIGTFCHEFGHVLGLVDYYATDGSDHATVGDWNIMDYGAYLNEGRTPPTYSAYDRFFLNWLKPVELINPSNITLEALSTSNKAYLITQNGNHNLDGKNPSPLEFFTLENRQKTGWDSYLPASGLLITRVYYNESDWIYNRPNNDPAKMGFDIIEADGKDYDNSLRGDPFPGSANITTYNPTLRNGTDINKPLTYINNKDGIVSFRFKGGGDVPTIETSSDFNTFKTVAETPSAIQSFTLSGKRLESDIEIEFFSNLHFELSLDETDELSWKKSLTIPSVDSIINSTTIYVRYNPLNPSFTNTHAEKMLIRANNAEDKIINISGVSSRPIYVVPPIAIDAENITSYSFIANWDIVKDNEKDAFGYYLTVYSTSEGESSKSEGFDNGITPSTGWKITPKKATTTPILCGEATPAIQFDSIDEYIETEIYPLPIKELSFFVKGVLPNNLSLNIQGLKLSTWTSIDTLNIDTSTPTSQSYSFDINDDFKQFRFTYNSGGGSIILDDVTVYFDKQVEFIESNKWVKSNKDTIYNLIPNREYIYKIQASDKFTFYDYENITDFSNPIYVKTLEDTNHKSLKVSIYTNGNITIVLPDEDISKTVYIYNSVGQIISAISESKNIINLQLPTGQFYILKVGNRISKIIL